ncbi:hypothetical protein, partial [Acinetobacter johnsonii]|uniref:hypothetical protein n=1 Tax=Acinetobacter johnsonii TaxID=40214 RepID=UPI001F2988AC
VNIRVGHVEYYPKRVSKYIDGLRFEIQDEMILLSSNFVEEAYQVGLKVEEKLARKSQGNSHGSFYGSGQQRGRGNTIYTTSPKKLE